MATKGEANIGAHGFSVIPALAYQTNLIVWFEADYQIYQDDAFTTPCAANNDVVGGWKDRTSGVHHLTQATGGLKPTYKTNVQNGLPAVNMSTGKLMAAAGFVWDDPFTIFVVCKRLSGTVPGNLVCGNAGTAAPPYMGGGSAGNMGANNGGGDFTLASAGIDAEYGVVTWKVDTGGGYLKWKSSGYDVSQANSNGSDMDGIKLQDATDNNILAILGYNESVSDANAAIVRDYLRYKYSLY